MEINGYQLGNSEKLGRAIEGTVGSNGEMTGGVGKDDENAILAQYDKLGGLITKDGRKIKTGAFFDVKKNEAIKDPKPVFIISVDGQFVEVPVDEEMPVEVKAAEQIAQRQTKATRIEELKKRGIALTGKEKKDELEQLLKDSEGQVDKDVE